MKPGLWETQVSSTQVTELPPEVEARLSAMPAAQQAQVRSMMGGAGAAPVVTTRQVCIAPQTSLDTVLNRAQQTPGMQCSFSNRTQTASAASFDIDCTGQAGSAKGHTDLHLTDDDRVNSTSHILVTATSQGHTMTSTIDTSTTAKFISADCGDVKPFSVPASK
jgi:hypothetical protein